MFLNLILLTRNEYDHIIGTIITIASDKIDKFE